MKTLITGAMALVLLASAAPGALAQDRPERGGDRGDRHNDRGDRGDRQREGGDRAAPPNDRGDRGDRQTEGGDRPREGGDRAAPPPGDRGGDTYNPAMRRSWRNTPEAPAQAAPPAQDRRDEGPRQGRDGGDRNWQGQPGQDRRGGQGGGEGPRERQAPGPDRRGQDWNRGGEPGRDGPRTWNRGDNRNWDRGDNRGWNQGQRDRPRPRYDRRDYPSTWQSRQHFRGYAYRAPLGFYARSWGFGDVLPRAWWTPQYRLNNWWDYGLPVPPIGYEWVRVGNDALLVDMFTGRVVQVAFDLFW